MNLSTNTRYAIRVLFELREPDRMAPIAVLAERTGIALKTVEKIHTVLKQHGITDSTVGARGGIFLRVPLTEVTLGQTISLFDSGVCFAVCCGDKANECPNQQGCRISSAWGKISAAVQEKLDTISLWSILKEYPDISAVISPKIIR